MKALQAVQSGAQAGHDTDQAGEQFDFSGPWFNSRTAQRYVCCKTLASWYMWRKRHGIIPRNNGSVAKADLDRALRARKPRRIMASASLANLQLRHTGESGSDSHTSSISKKVTGVIPCS